ncbi:MAG: helix-turn-helix transcriptional regulator [Proteobacteria bacterium]|nr:helix-turn-helix transcriptional regulator [Pseudomonadota bacterium]
MIAADSTGGSTAAWLRGLPQAPARSSLPYGWRHLEAHRYDGLRCTDLTLPPTGRHFIAIHLLRPCHVETRWGERTHRGHSVPGNAMLMAAGQESTWQCSSPIDELHVFLDPLLVREVADEIGLGSFELVDGVALIDPAFADLARQLLAELEGPGLGTRLFADTAARALALHLLRHHSNARAGEAPARLEMTARQLRVATEFIEAHLGEELTLESISAAPAMSPFRFARAFRKATGQSPRQYVIGRRIERAKSLLSAGELELADIANRVGFATQSHFTTVFRQRCGTTPKRYRDRCRS